MYLKDKQVAERFGVTRPTVWRWMHNGDFPEPVRLTKGCTRWRLSDVEAWEAARDQRKGVA